MVSCPLFISWFDMKYVIKRYQTGAQYRRLGYLIGLADLSSSHPYLLPWIYGIEHRCELVVQIQCQRFPLKREDTQQRNERPQFVLCNSIQTRFNSINKSHSNSNIKQKGKTKMKSKRTPEPDAELVTAIKCAPDNGACVTKVISVHKAAANLSSRAVARKAVLDIVKSLKLNHAKVQLDSAAYFDEDIFRVRIWKEKATADAWDKTVIYWLETMPLIKPVRNKLAKLGFNLN